MPTICSASASPSEGDLPTSEFECAVVGVVAAVGVVPAVRVVPAVGVTAVAHRAILDAVGDDVAGIRRGSC